MLESISWKEFFAGVTVLGGLYYVVAGLLLYKEELTSLFRNGLVKGKETSRDDNGSDEHVSFIGGTAKSGKEESDKGELRFAPDEKRVQGHDEYDVSPASLDIALVGTVADLGEDIKKLSEQIGQATRGQVGDRFRTLLKKYAKLDSTSYRATINLLISETIQEKSPHRVDAKEVDSWWATKEN